MKSDPNGSGEAASEMLQLLNGHLTVQAVHVAVALGVVDRLGDRPATVDTLAEEIGAHAPPGAAETARGIPGARWQ